MSINCINIFNGPSRNLRTETQSKGKKGLQNIKALEMQNRYKILWKCAETCQQLKILDIRDKKIVSFSMSVLFFHQDGTNKGVKQPNK